MKTTLNIPEPIMRDLKKKAAESGRTLSEIVAETLEKGLMQKQPPAKLRKLPVYNMGKAKVNIADRDQLYRAMEEE